MEPVLIDVLPSPTGKLPKALDRVLPDVNVEGETDVPVDLSELLELAGHR